MKELHQRHDIEIACPTPNDMSNIENIIETLNLEGGREVVIGRDDDYKFVTMQGAWYVLSLGDKITVFEDGKFVWGWV